MPRRPAALYSGAVGLEGEPARLAKLFRVWCSSKPGLDQLWLFGSRAKGTFSPGSDIDLGYVMVGATAGERAGNWCALTQNYKQELDAISIGVPVSATHWDPETSDGIVANAIREHGILLFNRFSNSNSPATSPSPLRAGESHLKTVKFA